MNREQLIRCIKAVLLEWNGTTDGVGWESLANAVEARLMEEGSRFANRIGFHAWLGPPSPPSWRPKTTQEEAQADADAEADPWGEKEDEEERNHDLQGMALGGAGRPGGEHNVSERAHWDDGNIDPTIRPVVAALNALRGIRTTESCEGHPGESAGRVWFQYRPSGRVPSWVTPLMEQMRDFPGCLGCYRLQVIREARLDCAHTLHEDWYIQIAPRGGITEQSEPGVKAIWGAVASILEAMAQKENKP